MFGNGLRDRVIDGHAQHVLASLARGDTGHDFCPVVEHRLGVETAHIPGDALHDSPGILANYYTHILIIPLLPL